MILLKRSMINQVFSLPMAAPDARNEHVNLYSSFLPYPLNVCSQIDQIYYFLEQKPDMVSHDFLTRHFKHQTFSL